MKNTFHCACGDQPYIVPDARAAQTWVDQAFWCSGTLAMLAYDGSTQYVWNPYSLQQLRDRMGGLDRYLECVSRGGGECSAPTDPVFEAQQVRCHNLDLCHFLGTSASSASPTKSTRDGMPPDPRP